MAHPAVQILPLLGLAHAADVGGEDHEKGRQHGVRLRPAGVLGEQAVHDGGALHDQTRHVLQRVTHIVVESQRQSQFYPKQRNQDFVSDPRCNKIKIR